MHDIIVIGSATIDVFVQSKKFQVEQREATPWLVMPYGAKQDVEQMVITTGGGATNVAVGMARLGLSAAIVCEMGRDFAAQMIWDELRKEQVETQFIVTEFAEDTAISSILVGPDGGRTVFTFRGATYQLESRDLPWDHLSATRWIHLNSLGGNKQLLFDLFEFAAAHELGMSWTPSSKDLEVLATGELQVESVTADVLIMNHEEWQTLEKLHAPLLQQVEMIIVTTGKKGGTVYVQGVQHLEYSVQPVQTVDETGAGDSFTTGFIGGLLSGASTQECVEWGKRNAASVVQSVGPKQGLLMREEIGKNV